LRFSWLFIAFLLFIPAVQAQGIVERCPGTGIQFRSPNFEPSGIILTAFDSAAVWVYNISRDTRYPLPDTRPCTSNCHLSPDYRWFTYLDPTTYTFGKMRLDGTERTHLVAEATEVQWWDESTLLIWTPDHRAYLRPEADVNAAPEFLNVRGIRSLQPYGRWGLYIAAENGQFNRYLLNLENRDTPEEQRYLLAPDRTYFNAAAWSHDGRYLAYVGDGALDESVGARGGEIFLASPNNAIPQQLTYLSSEYGAVRINGYAPADLSWSPDNSRIAFWVLDMTGSDPGTQSNNAVLHMLDIRSLELYRYCAFTAAEHTPETPRLIWSPDGTHLAFAGNVPGDDKGALLLALNVESGQFTELSNGMFPVFGIPQLSAWGHAP
jgi:Tol biopolymer transport system component